MPQLLIIPIPIQINARPPPKQRQRTINRPQAPKIPKLLLRLLLRPSQHRTQQRQKLNSRRVSPELRLRRLPYLRNILRHHGRTMSRHENRLGMLCRERLPGFGCPRLEDHGRALGAGLADVRAGHGEVFAGVVDFAHACWVRVDSAGAVQDHGV